VTVISAVLTLALFAFIIRLAVTGKGFRGNSFSLKKAMQGSNSFAGDAVGRLLAVVTIITLLLTTSIIPGYYIERLAVPAILAVVIGVLISLRITDRVLAIFATLLTIAEIIHKDGPQAGLGVAILSLLALWLIGAVRGFR